MPSKAEKLQQAREKAARWAEVRRQVGTVSASTSSTRTVSPKTIEQEITSPSQVSDKKEKLRLSRQRAAQWSESRRRRQGRSLFSPEGNNQEDENEIEDKNNNNDEYEYEYEEKDDVDVAIEMTTKDLDSSSVRKDKDEGKNNVDDDGDEEKGGDGDGIKLWKHMGPLSFVLYLIGLIWVLAFPVVSVVTGELKCRGLFVDESSLLYGGFESRPLPRKQANEEDLCSVEIANTKSATVTCQSLSNDVELVEVNPATTSTEAKESVAVLVIPSSTTSNSNSSNNKMYDAWAWRAMMHGLADPVRSPWLAKRVMLVYPLTKTTTRHELVDTFLRHVNNESSSPSLLRTVLVVELEASSELVVGNNNRVDLRILPQGRRGVLPNLDLVSAVTMRLLRRQNVLVKMHPYHEMISIDAMIHWLSPYLTPQWKRRIERYLQDLMGMVYFAISMTMGPYPPHAPFLDRNIDSLTLRVRYNNDKHHETERWLVPEVEVFVRMVSSLYEKLHHSVTQYLLPSSTKFVGNGEYIYPMILMLMPLLATSLRLLEGEEATFTSTSIITLLGIGVGVPVAVVVFTRYASDLWMVVVSLHGLIYAVALVGSLFRRSPSSCFQPLVALWALYLHVPLGLGHVSLGLPSTMLWSPIVSFSNGILGTIVWIFLWWPLWKLGFVFTITDRHSNDTLYPYSYYWWGVFVPLHLCLGVILWHGRRRCPTKTMN